MTGPVAALLALIWPTWPIASGILSHFPSFQPREGQVFRASGHTDLEREGT